MSQGSDETSPQLRETLQIKKFDMTDQDELKKVSEITVSDKLYTHDHQLISSESFTIPGWLGEWSLFNNKMRVFDAKQGLVTSNKPRKAVAIIGAQREYIPESVMNSKEWEVWGCNSLWDHARDSVGRFRADRWFEMHPLSVQTEEEYRKMAECPIPLYTLEYGEAEEQMRRAVQYPFEKVMAFLPRNYFTCTFAYQVALAIADGGFTDIGVFGCELMFGTPRERLFERSCLEFWMGVAMGRGIRVHFPKNSQLCSHPYRYGYQYELEKEYCDRKTRFFSVLEMTAFARNGGTNEQWTDGIDAEVEREAAEYQGPQAEAEPA